MKRLYESILSSTGVGKYREGAHIIEDGVPCTVVMVRDNKAYLLSDIYLGRNKYYQEGMDIDNYLSSKLEYKFLKTAEQTKKIDIPKGWTFPGKEYTEIHTEESKELAKKLEKYIKADLVKSELGISSRSKYMEYSFLVQDAYKDKCDGVYSIPSTVHFQPFQYNFEFKDNKRAVRFAKVVEL